MKKIVTLYILISVLVQGCEQRQGYSQEIVGKWKLLSLSIHGSPCYQEDGKELITTFSEDGGFEIQVGSTDAGKGIYTLDDLNLDMIFESTSNRPPAIVKYIFFIENKTLTLCNLENGIRPPNFNSTTNSILQVLRKMKQGEQEEGSDRSRGQ